MSKITTKSFIRSCELIHKYKYDYSLVKYKKAKEKINIICKIHGVFEQEAYSHKTGKGCPECNGRNKITSSITKEAKLIHGDTYDYSKLEFKLKEEPVIIICKIHGEFLQTPYKHINKKQGCKKCKNIENGKNKAFKYEDFLNLAIAKHGNKFTYLKETYISKERKFFIICPKHGKFSQTPKLHLSTTGCPKCKIRNLSELKLLNFLKGQFKNLDIVSQAKPSWLKGKTGNRQSLDIYIKEYNIAIEYQGKQHFSPVSIFGGIKGFCDNQLRDERKRNLSIEANCKLLYFSYDKKDIPKDYKYKVYNLLL